MATVLILSVVPVERLFRQLGCKKQKFPISKISTQQRVTFVSNGYGFVTFYSNEFVESTVQSFQVFSMGMTSPYALNWNELRRFFEVEPEDVVSILNLRINPLQVSSF